MTGFHGSVRGGAGFLLALGLACRPAPPPPPNDDTGANPPPGDSAAPVPDSLARPDTVPVAPPPNDTTPRRMATLADLRAEVMRMIANLNATDAGQCRTIAFGAKPCGGPKQYLVYSAAATDSSALAAAVARYNAREAELNQSEGRVSDCMMVTPPEVALVNGRCVPAP